MDHSVNRRDFLGQFAAAGTALALGTRADAQVTRDVLGAPKAPDGQVLKAGLIGCGGRGRGAMINFLDAGPNLQLTALADLFPDRLEAARQQLKADKGIDVPANRCFTGFDAHQKLIDSGVDIVLNCTPPHFRPMHFAACVEAGKHCFLEKPLGVDAAGVRSVLATSEKASSKGLAVMTGTQLRREQPRMEVRNRVIDGAIEHWQASRDSTPYSLTYLTIAAALTRLAGGETEAALETARKALDYADRSRFRLEQGAAHRVLGQAYAATGNPVEAEAAFRESLGILEAIRSWPELGQTLLAYGQFKLRRDDVEGPALIERARAMFEEIGATGWVDEAQAAIGR